MSAHYLRFVPTLPTFVPTPAAAVVATTVLREMLATLPHWPGMPVACVEAKFLDAIEFVDAGQNTDGADCPACGASTHDWWGDAMDEAYASTRFSDLHARARCCDTIVDLNALRYRWPVAFGHFVLEAEPFASGQLSESQVALLGEALGCPLRQIPTHI